MERREIDARLGKMGAVLAVFGRDGTSSMVVGVDVIVLLLGKRTWIPFLFVITLRRGMSVWIYLFQKWEVAPMSAIFFSLRSSSFVSNENLLLQSLLKWAGRK